ncbi:MAG: hypothetical protein AB7P52_04095 [Alphaproteobacteria bacterium]
MSTLAEARASIAEIYRFLAQGRAALERGDAFDISPLEPVLRALAGQVGALPAAEAGTLKPALIALYDELERFGTTLSEAHAALGQQLKGLSRGSRAASAYGKRPDKG